MIAFDFETFLIRPGLLAPPPVCVTTNLPEIRHAKDLDEDFFLHLLEQDPIVGANLSFDMGVLAARFPRLVPAIFRAYEEGRCRDVLIDQKLIDIAHGRLGGIYKLNERGEKKRVVEYRYSLAALEKRLLDIDRSAGKERPDAWRFRYHELYHVPLDEWPQDAIDYAIADATGAAAVHEKQEAEFGAYLADGMAQAAADWSLHLMSCWGMRTNERNIRAFQKICEAEHERLTDFLRAHGLVRKDGTRDTKAAAARMIRVCEENGLPIPHTKTWDPKEHGPHERVSLDVDACEASGDEVLEAYAERVSLHTIVTTHIPALYMGIDSVIQPAFNVLVESGRTSCKGADSGRGRPKEWCGQNKCIPRSTEDRFCVECGEMLPATYGYQVQNVRRLEGIRECFEARPGTVFIDTDFSGLELCTLAQACLILVGRSKLAEAINAGLDAHLDMAAILMGISYEEAKARRHEEQVKKMRQLSKAANFGLPGGLGARTFVAYARGMYGLRISVEEAEQVKALWLRKWPEFRDYFRLMDRYIQEGEDGFAQIVQLFSGRVRGGLWYTNLCNTFFQGLGADVAKRAMFAVSKACYAEPDSVLYGTRPVNFIHDQIISETPEEIAHETAFEQARVMMEAGNYYLPDVPVKCTPALSKVWTKGAEAVFLDGKLVPWDLAKAGKWNVTYEDGERVVW